MAQLGYPDNRENIEPVGNHDEWPLERTCRWLPNLAALATATSPSG
jgi:hypothetical protein